jgi:hypothetical protein
MICSCDMDHPHALFVEGEREGEEIVKGKREGTERREGEREGRERREMEREEGGE